MYYFAITTHAGATRRHINEILFTNINFFIRKCNIIILDTVLVLIGVIEKLLKGSDSVNAQ